MSNTHSEIRGLNVVSFGQRRTPPRLCVVENKQHVRSFLTDMFENLGFVVRGCAGSELESAMPLFNPDLIVFGQLGGREELSARLRRLKAANYGGRVMLFGGRGSLDLIEMHELGEQIGLHMLPLLGTPFRDGDLVENLSVFRPVTKPAEIEVEAGEALDKGWLELRYQPVIDARTLSVSGAEAFILVNHPVWGVAPPAFRGDGSASISMRTLAEFAVARSREDWSVFAAGKRNGLLSLNIPLPALEDTDFAAWLVRQVTMPAGAGPFAVEISGIEAAGNLARVIKLAQKLGGRDIGVVIDRVGAEIIRMLNRSDLRFAGLKADEAIANGCADDDDKRALCAKLVAAARTCGARAVAEGVKTRADFRVLCELGFDLIQGLLFAPPLEARKFMKLLMAQARASA